MDRIAVGVGDVGDDPGACPTLPQSGASTPSLPHPHSRPYCNPPFPKNPTCISTLGARAAPYD